MELSSCDKIILEHNGLTVHTKYAKFNYYTKYTIITLLGVCVGGVPEPDIFHMIQQSDYLHEKSIVSLKILPNIFR